MHCLAGLILFWITFQRKTTFNSVDLISFVQVGQLNDWSLNDVGFKNFEKPKDWPILFSKLPFLQYLGPFLNFVQK